MRSILEFAFAGTRGYTRRASVSQTFKRSSSHHLVCSGIPIKNNRIQSLSPLSDRCISQTGMNSVKEYLTNAAKICTPGSLRSLLPRQAIYTRVGSRVMAALNGLWSTIPTEPKERRLSPEVNLKSRIGPSITRSPNLPGPRPVLKPRTISQATASTMYAPISQHGPIND
jgi:hypothetical protein